MCEIVSIARKKKGQDGALGISGIELEADAKRMVKSISTFENSFRKARSVALLLNYPMTF